MKKLPSLIIILALLLAGCGRGEKPAAAEPTQGGASVPSYSDAPGQGHGSAPSPTPEPTMPPTPKPVSDEVKALLPRNDEVWAEKHQREFMEGRLLIPSVGIDVALIVWGDGTTDEDIRQRVTDAEDSALIYFDGNGNVIADHKTQDFMTLTEVQIGDTAFILLGDSIYTLRCDLVTDGINTGNGITNADGRNVTALEDYTCYTCMEDWTNIRIVGFQVIDVDNVVQPLLPFSYQIPLPEGFLPTETPPDQSKN